MNIDYSAFACPTMGFIPGDGLQKTYPLPCFPPDTSGCDGEFDLPPEDRMEAIGAACAKALFAP